MRKKLNRLEIRILQQMMQIRRENPGATVAFRAKGLGQYDACVFLQQRGLLRMSPPIKEGRSKTYEYYLTPSGIKYLNKFRTERQAANA